MTSRRAIIIFWTLLLVPALVLAGSAFRLLTLEQDRIRKSNITTLEDQARQVALTLDQSVSSIQANLTRSLQDIHSKGIRPALIEKRLLAWEESNPLIRNVFIFHPRKGLIYPEQSRAATNEERQFISRFEPLMTGRIGFDFNRPADRETRASAPALAKTNSLYSLSRQSVPLARKSETLGVGDDEAASAKGAGTVRSGWIPWFSDNQLYILGWVQPDPDGVIFGLELEMMTLLSRLVTQIPENSYPGTALVVMDGNGTPVLQTGPLEFDGKILSKDAMLRLDVSFRLPHWSVCVFTDDSAFSGSHSFLVLSLMLVGILVTAIVSAGVLITRLTLAQIKDARQKTSFVAAVSHELKTPLTSIRMYAELLLSKRVSNPEKQNNYLEVMVAESERLTRLINNILDFGKLEQGKKQYRVSEFDMADILKECIHTNELRFKKAGFNLITKIPDQAFPVATDRDAMAQVFLNLFDNAIKYAKNGRFIKISLDRTPDHVEIFIRDDGPGIPTGVREKIFEKFFRADNSLTTAQPGSGLGLSITRQMLNDLGGRIEVDPSVKQGAGFIIRIPIHE